MDTKADTVMSTALIKTYELPRGADTQLFAKLATTHGLRVVELAPTRISVTGSDGAVEVFTDILDQLRRLCR